MTLNTNVYVMGPVDVDRLWDILTKLIGPPNPPYKFNVEEHDFYTERWGIPGQGADAWLTMQFTTDGNAFEDSYSEWDLEDDEDERRQLVNWFVKFDFDTAYGYRDEYGRTCTELHSDYIKALGAYFDALGVNWKWQNEYTGEIHNRFDGLDEFGKNGDDAVDWFENLVRPMIENAINSRS